MSGGRPTKGLVGALHHQVPCHAVHLAAGLSVGDVQSLLDLFIVLCIVGLVGLLHWLLGLERGQVEEVVEHLFELGQVLGIGEEAGLEVEGELCGVDVDHCF